MRRQKSRVSWSPLSPGSEVSDCDYPPAVHLDSAESSDPIDVEQKQLLETNSLVEEFMLLANCSVAAKIQDSFPQTAVLRRHGCVTSFLFLFSPSKRILMMYVFFSSEPPKTNFENLDDLLFKLKGMHLDASSSAALAASLDRCVVSDALGGVPAQFTFLMLSLPS